MQAIRSILWVGPETGLAQNGVLKATQLDVTWTRDAETARRIPLGGIDVVVLSASEERQSIDLEDALRYFIETSEKPPILALVHPRAVNRFRLRMPVNAGEVVPMDPGGAAVDEDTMRADLQSRIERLCRASIRGSSDSDRHIPAGLSIRRNNARSSVPTELGAPGFAGEIIGRSEAIRASLQLAERAADGKSTILLSGETGTGKEIFARAIHRRSQRAEQHSALCVVQRRGCESQCLGHQRRNRNEISAFASPVSAGEKQEGHRDPSQH